MLKIKSYVKVNSIAEAYELNQKKTACVLGGMVWLKMGNRNISTAIDLSGLGLEGIQETDIDCETMPKLNTKSYYYEVLYTPYTLHGKIGRASCRERV